MLAPKEDRFNNKLMYCCRMCQYSEEADSACIFRNNIYNVIGETAGVTQDVGSDPTVGLPDLWCTLCGQTIACSLCEGVDGGELEADDSSSEEGEGDVDDERNDDANGGGGMSATEEAAGEAADQKLHGSERGVDDKNTRLT